MTALLGLCRRLTSLSVGSVPHLRQHASVKTGVILSGPTVISSQENATLRSLTTLVTRNNTGLNKTNQSYLPSQVTAKRNLTLNQIHRRKPKRKLEKNFGLLNGNAFKRALVLKTVVKKPKKPNSASRKCVRVKLSNGAETTAYVPKEGHNLQEHNIVLVGGGNLQDVPGVKLSCIRGKYDLPHVIKKKKL